jgi:hypothetical protein
MRGRRASQTATGYVARRPKEGPWPAFSCDRNDAVKFRTADEAADWLSANGVNGVDLFAVRAMDRPRSRSSGCN